MLNKTVLQGRLTRDVELKSTQGGIAFTNITVAWSEKYKETETKCFLTCKAWRQTAEFLARYFGKGSEVIVEGRLVTEEWTDKDGNKQSRVVLDVDKAHFAGSKKDAGQADQVITDPDEPLPF